MAQVKAQISKNLVSSESSDSCDDLTISSDDYIPGSDKEK